MKRYFLAAIFNIFLVLCFSRSVAQQSADTVSQTVAVTNTINYFNNVIGQQSRLYNGPEYLLYDHNIKGTAYFPDEQNGWISGTVIYDGFKYDNVPLMYDLYKDILVALLYNKFSRYALISERVSDFWIQGHHFIRVTSGTLDKTATLQTGFYEQLYPGKTEVLARHSKTIQTTSNTAVSLDKYFSATDDYYVKKGNEFFSFKSQSSLLKILKDKKKEIQQFLKANNIIYKTDPETAMIAIATYYDRITQ
jgi:hypothetical protein